jgi:hypothetical protein
LSPTPAASTMPAARSASSYPTRIHFPTRLAGLLGAILFLVSIVPNCGFQTSFTPTDVSLLDCRGKNLFGSERAGRWRDGFLHLRRSLGTETYFRTVAFDQIAVKVKGITNDWIRMPPEL